MSGVNAKGMEIRKGAAEAIKRYVEAGGGIFSKECEDVVKRIAGKGGHALGRRKEPSGNRSHLFEDIIKSGVKEKFADLRRWGLRL